MIKHEGEEEKEEQNENEEKKEKKEDEEEGGSEWFYLVMPKYRTKEVSGLDEEINTKRGHSAKKEVWFHENNATAIWENFINYDLNYSNINRTLMGRRSANSFSFIKRNK